MPTVMVMRWEGVTPDQYDAVEKAVDWTGAAPAGGVHHVAWFTDGGLNVVDVWESEDEFNTFAQDRLMPGVAKAGIEGEPKVDMHDTHRVYAPGYDGSLR